jgi:hypothetical protein
MLIKMLQGTFGALENGAVVAKTSQSAPFEVDDVRGRQLVEAGYAREVGKDVQVSQALPVQGPKGEERETDSGENVSEKGEPGNAEKALSEYSFTELRNMAKEMGLKADGKKEQLEERIAAHRAGQQEKSEEEDVIAVDEGDPDGEGEAFPALQPEDPV